MWTEALVTKHDSFSLKISKLQSGRYRNVFKNPLRTCGGSFGIC